MRDIRDIKDLQGDGPALVLVPGIQGRWEYARPTVEALAKYFRVVTFSLGAAGSFDGEVERILSALDERQIERAVVCGISYGGLVTTRFAAIHPARTTTLVLASVPGPNWRPRPHHRFYAQWPWLLAPLFFAETPFRLSPEVAAALPRRADRVKFARWQLATIVAAPVSLSQMAARARLLPVPGLADDCQRVIAPTLVVTGVVPVESTASYVTLIHHARRFVLERSGHQGTITRPSVFAAAVNEFVRNVPAVASGFSRTSSRDVASGFSRTSSSSRSEVA